MIEVQSILAIAIFIAIPLAALYSGLLLLLGPDFDLPSKLGPAQAEIDAAREEKTTCRVCDEPAMVIVHDGNPKGFCVGHYVTHRGRREDKG